MALVLGVAAGEFGDPVLVVVLMKTDDRRVACATPSVRVVFAFGQILV